MMSEKTLPPLDERHLRIKTISVTYGRKLNLGNYESAHSEVAIWADLDPASNINEADAVLGLRDMARNNVLSELAKHKGAAIEAKTAELYMGLPVELQEAVDIAVGAIAPDDEGA